MERIRLEKIVQEKIRLEKEKERIRKEEEEEKERIRLEKERIAKEEERIRIAKEEERIRKEKEEKKQKEEERRRKEEEEKKRKEEEEKKKREAELRRKDIENRMLAERKRRLESVKREKDKRERKGTIDFHMPATSIPSPPHSAPLPRFLSVGSSPLTSLIPLLSSSEAPSTLPQSLRPLFSALSKCATLNTHQLAEWVINSEQVWFDFDTWQQQSSEEQRKQRCVDIFNEISHKPLRLSFSGSLLPLPSIKSICTNVSHNQGGQYDGFLLPPIVSSLLSMLSLYSSLHSHLSALSHSHSAPSVSFVLLLAQLLNVQRVVGSLIVSDICEIPSSSASAADTMRKEFPIKYDVYHTTQFSDPPHNRQANQWDKRSPEPEIEGRERERGVGAKMDYSKGSPSIGASEGSSQP
ncbi:hypothetical protein ADUPG1_009920, partial [Aduncisulcus paluster]